MRLAVGLFHFNIQYVAGDVSRYQRYCTQAIIPFLEAIDCHSHFKVSVEMCGQDIEFLARFHPDAFQLLKDLIVREQIELVSALYTPSIWVAFPGRDLRKSVEINRRCLRGLGITASPCFFSQEAFFGLGLGTLSNDFNLAICKDDYLNYFLAADKRAHSYMLDGMRVLVGSNHLLNERIRRGMGVPNKRRAAISATSSIEPNCIGTTQDGSSKSDLEWYWYHFGSGHHFSTPSPPTDWDSFFSAEWWVNENCDLLGLIESEGYQLSSLESLGREIVARESSPNMFPLLPEGSWNSAESLGVFTWMGLHNNLYEQDPGILSVAWRGRDQIVSCEKTLACLGAETRATYRDDLDGAWKRQLAAECSDPLGWRPLPIEVTFGRNAGDQTLQASYELLRKLRHLTVEKAFETEPYIAPRQWASGTERLGVECGFIQCEGDFKVSKITNEFDLVEAEFLSRSKEAGVWFAKHDFAITYSPSGLEGELRTLDLCNLLPDEIYLPLANGLVQLHETTWLIRENRFGYAAARFSKDSRRVSFLIRGELQPRRYYWRFFLFRGNSEQALNRAAVVNWI